jgi:LacI family transcriptional regulator
LVIFDNCNSRIATKDEPPGQVVMTATLKDIAREVGVSVTTVSRALAGYDDVAANTRQEVERVAQAMGYEPNITARNLQRQRTDTIALILPSANELRFSDPFFSELLSGIVEEMTQHGFNLNVSTTTADNENETYLKAIRSSRVDGFIIVRTRREDGRINLLREHNVPFVAFGRVEQGNDFHLVDEDGYLGIRQIMDHLVLLGHTRMACIAEPTHLTKSYHRLQGFLDGLRAHNLPHDPNLIIETNFRQRSGRQGALQLFDIPNPPTAIVACNDLLALGAINAAQERGLTVGKDVSVTGFDDILLAEYANPPLTTVHQPAQQFGHMMVKMLTKVINQEPIKEKQIIIEPPLIIRQSTGPVPRT